MRGVFGQNGLTAIKRDRCLYNDVDGVKMVDGELFEILKGVSRVLVEGVWCKKDAEML